jgi:hypothetical protein
MSMWIQPTKFVLEKAKEEKRSVCYAPTRNVAKGLIDHVFVAMTSIIANN